jgi:hypothetical protein
MANNVHQTRQLDDLMRQLEEGIVVNSSDTEFLKTVIHQCENKIKQCKLFIDTSYNQPSPNQLTLL